MKPYLKGSKVNFWRIKCSLLCLDSSFQDVWKIIFENLFLQCRRFFSSPSSQRRDLQFANVNPRSFLSSEQQKHAFMIDEIGTNRLLAIFEFVIIIGIILSTRRPYKIYVQENLFLQKASFSLALTFFYLSSYHQLLYNLVKVSKLEQLFQTFFTSNYKNQNCKEDGGA